MNTFIASLIRFLFPERKDETTVAQFSLDDFSRLSMPVEQLNDVTSLFSYKDPRVRSLIWELKYHRNARALSLVGQALADAITDELSDKTLFENWQQHTLLVPIPITAKRLRERTFSQTDLLCREIEKYVPDTLHYAPNALSKIRETKKQSWTNSRYERMKNLEGCFWADPNIITGKYVILIDDVTTTGTTLNEARTTLLSAGAQKVLSFTIAH